MKRGKIEFAPDYKSEKPKHQIGNLACTGFSAYDYNQLVQWMKDPNRKSAITAFTSGHVRDAARAFEDAIR